MAIVQHTDTIFEETTVCLLYSCSELHVNTLKHQAYAHWVTLHTIMQPSKLSCTLAQNKA